MKINLLLMIIIVDTLGSPSSPLSFLPIFLPSSDSLAQDKFSEALGNKHEYGLDYDETFALVPKMTIVWTLIAVAAIKSWPILQIDVKMLFSKES